MLGIAAEGGVSFRGGAAGGPEGIRRLSESLESYSPSLRRDLAALRVIDLGDHTTPPERIDEAVGRTVDRAWTPQRRPVLAVLGGDHSVTPPVVGALADRADRLAVVGFDAHLDLRAHYPGEHACTFRRIVERGVPCVLCGPRSGSGEEWEAAPGLLDHVSEDLTLPVSVRRWLEGRDVYVSVDIDVLDPAVAPGTGNPEPGGPGFTELARALGELEGLRVVGFDVVEVAPKLDPSGVTQAAAAKLVRDLLLRVAGSG